MIIFGSGQKVRDLGRAGYGRCSRCASDQELHYMVEYRYLHLYWILRCVTGRNYSLACPACRYGRTIEREACPPALEGDPIPRWERWGLLAAAGALMALAAVASLTGC
jgi:hypothetical protein